MITTQTELVKKEQNAHDTNLFLSWKNIMPIAQTELVKKEQNAHDTNLFLSWKNIMPIAQT